MNLLQLSTVNKYKVYQAKDSRNILSVFFDKLSLPVAEDRLCGFDQLFQKYKWDMLIDIYVASSLLDVVSELQDTNPKWTA